MNLKFSLKKSQCSATCIPDIAGYELQKDKILRIQYVEDEMSNIFRFCHQIFHKNFQNEDLHRLIRLFEIKTKKMII